MERHHISRYLNVDGLKRRLAELDDLIEPMLAEREELASFLDLYLRDGDEHPGASISDDAERERDRSQDASVSGPDAAVALAPATSGPAYVEMGGMALAKEAVAILRQAGRRLTTNDIFEALRGAGIVPKGENKLQGVYAALYRHERITGEIRKVGRGEWELAIEGSPEQGGGTPD
jgi:hypothetical protein